MSPLLASHRFIELQRFAASFREAACIVQRPLSPPGPGEIAVRNLFVGINGLFDRSLARNAFSYVNITPPVGTGVEAIGIVEAVGEGASGFAVGDAAAAVRFGDGYREWAVGAESRFVKMPAARAEMLALASTGVAAYLALTRIGELKDGETVAISAAAGGLGHLMVQIAKSRGCRVVAVAGGAEKCALASRLGADRVIDYRKEDVAAVLGAEFKDRLDVAVDSVSGAIFDAFLANLAPHGRLVVAGQATDQENGPVPITAPRVGDKLYFKGASVRAFQNGLLTPHWPVARAEMIALHEAGKLEVALDPHGRRGLEAVFDLSERLAEGGNLGKVILPL
jgi:hypothetical protein